MRHSIALLALVSWCWWISRRVEFGDTSFFLPEGVVRAVTIACTVLAGLAVGYVVIIVVRAFYLGLTESERQKHERDG